MKAELQNGPISCGIDATDNFDNNYDGTTIYSEHVRFVRINHEISVVGYGMSPEGEEYWIGRNSWGTYWGDFGFFYLPMGAASTNLGIETDCLAGTPSYTKAKHASAELFTQ